MTNFYLLKAKATELVDNMIMDQKEDVEILYRLSKVYGFGQKMISERRKVLEGLQELSEKKKNEDN